MATTIGTGIRKATGALNKEKRVLDLPIRPRTPLPAEPLAFFLAGVWLLELLGMPLFRVPHSVKTPGRKDEMS